MDLGNETTCIHRVTCTKFLGIYIDEDLEWSAHIDHVAKKISSGCYAIRSAKHLLSAENLRALYFSLVHSHLSYGNMVWGSAYQFKLKRLVQLQNKCVRHICKLSNNESTSSSFKKLGIAKISHIFNIQLGKLMYSFSNGQHNTRHHKDPHVVSRKRSVVSKSFIHAAPKIWFELPANIKACKTTKSFKYKLKSYFVDKY